MTGPVSAQTWDGETNTLWSNSTNWSPNGVPGLLGNVTITGSLSISNGVTNNAGLVTGSTFVSGGQLRLNDGTNLSDSAALNIASGAVSVFAPETVGLLTLNGGTLSGASCFGWSGHSASWPASSTAASP